MIADFTAQMKRRAFDDEELPVLSPVVVVAGADVEHVFQEARASIAMLTLELRAAISDAEEAGSHQGVMDLNVLDLNVEENAQAAHEWLQLTINRSLEVGRAELAVRLDEARGDAARIVAQAQTEAAALVEEAREEMSRLLLGRAGSSFVPSAEASMHTAPNVDHFSAYSNGLKSTSLNGASARINGASNSLNGAPTVINAASAAVQAEEVIESVISEPELIMAPVVIAEPLVVPVAPDPVNELSAILPALEPVTLEPVAFEPAKLEPALLKADRKRPYWAKIFYVDVLLPLTAVFILIALLLALVG